MPKIKIDLISHHADWGASVTVDAATLEQAERLALKCMANPDAWRIVALVSDAAGAREDHECVYENGDGICRECTELAKRPKPFGYACAIDYRRIGQEPDDLERA